MGFNTFPCNPYPISTDELNKGNNDELNTRVTALEGNVSDLEEQKANQITIALSFNPETTYNPGDLVYYNGLTYRCTNEHTGEWDADDFTGTTIANELSALKSGLTNVVKTVTETLTTSQYNWIAFPAGREILGAYMTVNNTYLSFIVNFDANVGGYITNMYVNTNGQTIVYIKLEANTDYTITYKYI